MPSNRSLPIKKCWQTDVQVDTKLPYLRAPPVPSTALPRSSMYRSSPATRD